MYCAEFVYKSFLASCPAVHFTTSHLNDFEFVGVDDLFVNPVCKEIKRTSFK
jgi:hypothetical protein